MKVLLDTAHYSCEADLRAKAIDSSLPQRPYRSEDGCVRCFGLPVPEATPFTAGSFVADVSKGGSVNCDVVTFCPHSSGTHTECLAHIVPGHRSITELDLGSGMFLCTVVTVQPEQLEHSGDTYPVSEPADLVVSKKALQSAWNSIELDHKEEFVEALVIRTLPNGDEKRTFDWSGKGAPYLTGAAVAWAKSELGFKHLVVDLPSVDRESDGGNLVAHRAAFGVSQDLKSIEPHDSMPNSTVTELAYVPSSAPDGQYLLNLQVSGFAMDAAPSKPVLFPLALTNKSH